MALAFRETGRPFLLKSREGVVARRFSEMAGVIECKNTDIAAPADLESVYPAIGSYDPRGLLCVAADCAHEVKGEKTDRPGMGEYRYPAANIGVQDVPEFGCAALQEVLIALAICNYVVDLAVNQGVIVVRVGCLRFVERQALEGANVALAKGSGCDDRHPS